MLQSLLAYNVREADAATFTQARMIVQRTVQHWTTEASRIIRIPRGQRLVCTVGIGDSTGHLSGSCDDRGANKRFGDEGELVGGGG
jgi:hypothetical protein